MTPTRTRAAATFFGALLGVMVAGLLRCGVAAAEEKTDRLSIHGLQKLAELPEEEIDIGRAAILMASDVFVDVDIDRYLEQLKTMAEEIRSQTPASATAQQGLQVMNAYLFETQGYHVVPDNPRDRYPKTRFLHELMDTHAGSTWALCALYVALAQRLHYPVYPALAPGHCYCQLVTAGGQTTNIEFTKGGASVPADYYRKQFQIPKKAIAAGAYLTPMTYREFLGWLIAGNGWWWSGQNPGRAIVYYRLAIPMSPKAGEAYLWMAKTYWALSTFYQRGQNTGYEDEYMLAANDAWDKAVELGIAKKRAPRVKPKDRTEAKPSPDISQDGKAAVNP